MYHSIIERCTRVVQTYRMRGQLTEVIDMSILARSWNGRTIRQRADGYLSLTDMAQACEKRVANWERLDSTQEYLKALELRRYSDVSNGNLIEIQQGGIPENQGTWGHRKVALRFAQWLSADFAVQVDEWIEELLLTGKVELPQQRQIEPLKREQQLDALKMLYTLNERVPDDRTTITLKAHLTNLIEASQQAELTPQLLSVTEICQAHGIILPKGVDVPIGRKAAKEWRQAHDGNNPQTCQKHVGTNHVAGINIYPEDFFERVIAIASEFIS